MSSVFGAMLACMSEIVMPAITFSWILILLIFDYDILPSVNDLVSTIASVNGPIFRDDAGVTYHHARGTKPAR